MGLYKESEQGLLVPTTEQEVVHDEERRLAEKYGSARLKYGATQIQDDDQRKLVSKLLTGLWLAMKLHGSGGGIVFPDDCDNKEQRRKLLYFVAEQLLGDDSPGFEILC